MKLFLIKIGKVWSVIQREGVATAAKQAAYAFIATYCTPPKEGDILLVSGGVGDSARYRTRHVAEELELNGFRASYVPQASPFFMASVEKFQVIVFHRVLFTEAVAKYVARAKELNRTIIFETDDLVYDPKYLHLMDYYKNMNVLEKKLYEHGVGGELLADPYVTHCTTTTTFLKRKLEERGKTVFLVTNKMSEEDVVWAEELRGVKHEDDGTIHISYLSGTPSHNKDLATITGALVKILKEFPETRLVLVGPVEADNALYECRSQIIRIPFAPRKEFFATIASVDINVAPLEMNDFTESKSELKFFEAGILGVPTVAVANETYRGAITEGEDGFLAATESDWYEKLKLLVTNPELRNTIANNALQTALTKYTTKNGKSEEYYQFLRRHINRA
jgi:glycosyltransferase involved in cell wall biosynthesis